MSKLYIIGNGFDRAHALETEYKHFRTYIASAYVTIDHCGTYYINMLEL